MATFEVLPSLLAVLRLRYLIDPAGFGPIQFAEYLPQIVDVEVVHENSVNAIEEGTCAAATG